MRNNLKAFYECIPTKEYAWEETKCRSNSKIDKCSKIRKIPHGKVSMHLMAVTKVLCCCLELNNQLIIQQSKKVSWKNYKY